MKRFLLLSLMAILLAINLHAQRNCGAMDLLNQHLEEDPKLEQKMQRIEQATRSFLKKDATSRMPGTITIPVVVHVVYNGNTENISEAQINSQIRILNEDFRRLNGDASNTPSDFLGIASDIEIEFCLASVDPNGNPTNGITRTPTTRSSFGTNDAVKSASSGGKNPWPASDYLNVWVCDIGGGILGYAQFPGGPPSTDGVVNDYRYFGDIGTATAPFNLGRTMTHEVGHYLNLRHIWGDGNCNADDLVGDTPRAGGPNYTGSPCTYPGPNSCNEGNGDLPDMFQNYMDYSDDGCMNLFTAGQKARMRALFDTGGARASLLNSVACGPPVVATCTDGIQNGNETGIDCGGPDCAPCQCAGTFVNVTIVLDNYPEETSWTIKNASGTTVAAGGTYGSQPDGSTVSEETCLPDGCYDFQINDAYGDGICCAYGSGSYSVTAGGVSVASGGNFASSESTNFCVGGGTGPTCTDGIQNGGETGIDCGGPDCDPCFTCSDGIQNGQETGVDCGGPDCAPCVQPPTCDDGIQNGQETGVDCGGPDCDPCDPGVCTQTTINATDFESGYGIWNDGGSDCALVNNSTYANSGNRSVRIRDNSSSSVLTTNNLNLSGFQEVVIDFSFIARSMESGEDFWLQASTNGGASYQTLTTWASGTDFANLVRESESVTITGNFSSSTRFRFRCDASSNADQIYLDDISITGCTNGNKEGARETEIEVTDRQEISEIKVYPNPTSDLLNVEFITTTKENVQVQVIDMAGKRIMNKTRAAIKGHNNIRLQVGDLNAGIYYIHLNDGKNQIIKKFVVTK